jgi:ligand-binding sensor domain-containing protein
MLRVYASPDGWWSSIEHGGLMRYDAGKKSWLRAGMLTRQAAAVTAPKARGSRISSPAPRTAPHSLEQVVNDMAFSSDRWFAATDAGLLMSADRGATWALKPLGPLTTLPVQSVRVSTDGQRLWVVSLRGLVFSTDGGTSWAWHDLPLKAEGAMTLNVDRDNEATMVSIAHNGLYISRDAGNTWQQAGSGLPSTPVQDLAIAGNVFLASMRTGGLYVSSDSGRTWTRVAGTLADGFFPAVTTEGNGEVIFAASATEGLYSVEWKDLAAASAKPPGQPKD